MLNHSKRFGYHLGITMIVIFTSLKLQIPPSYSYEVSSFER